MKIEPNKVKMIVIRDFKGTPILTVLPEMYELTTMKDKSQILTITCKK